VGSRCCKPGCMDSKTSQTFPHIYTAHPISSRRPSRPGIGKSTLSLLPTTGVLKVSLQGLWLPANSLGTCQALSEGHGVSGVPTLYTHHVTNSRVWCMWLHSMDALFVCLRVLLHSLGWSRANGSSLASQVQG
jgi:hypothetical protein